MTESVEYLRSRIKELEETVKRFYRPSSTRNRNLAVNKIINGTMNDFKPEVVHDGLRYTISRKWGNRISDGQLSVEYRCFEVPGDVRIWVSRDGTISES